MRRRRAGRTSRSSTSTSTRIMLSSLPSPESFARTSCLRASAGVVARPATLFPLLIDPSDVAFDPSCGLASFLVGAGVIPQSPHAFGRARGWRPARRRSFPLLVDPLQVPPRRSAVVALHSRERRCGIAVPPPPDLPPVRGEEYGWSGGEGRGGGRGANGPCGAPVAVAGVGGLKRAAASAFPRTTGTRQPFNSSAANDSSRDAMPCSASAARTRWRVRVKCSPSFSGTRPATSSAVPAASASRR